MSEASSEVDNVLDALGRVLRSFDADEKLALRLFGVVRWVERSLTGSTELGGLMSC